MKREGYFRYGRFRGVRADDLYPLRTDIWTGRVRMDLQYPVVVYDHDEGRSITDGLRLSRTHCRAEGQFVFSCDTTMDACFCPDLAAIKNPTTAFRKRSRRYGGGSTLRPRHGCKRVYASFRRSVDQKNGQTAPRRSAYQHKPRWRVVPHLTAGRMIARLVPISAVD